jgi:hypothetical protein
LPQHEKFEYPLKATKSAPTLFTPAISLSLLQRFRRAENQKYLNLKVSAILFSSKLHPHSQRNLRIPKLEAAPPLLVWGTG